MSVGLLLITHNEIGAALLTTVTRMLGSCPLRARALAVTDEADRDALSATAEGLVTELDEGDGVLVLTDIFGSSPANIAGSLQVRPQVLALAGVNLPMLVRVFNYPGLPLEALADKALSAGQAGVMTCRRPGSPVNPEVGRS
jgi:PTS system ascorbate-specific IIA component